MAVPTTPKQQVRRGLGPNRPRAVVVGAGPVGCLAARLLTTHGYTVDVIEKRPDLRAHHVGAYGRTINLSVSPRGLGALAALECQEALLHVAVPMDRRIIHTPAGHRASTHYGAPERRNYSVARNALNALLLDRALEPGGGAVQVHFDTKCVAIDFQQQAITVVNVAGQVDKLRYDLLVGADGASSAVRHQLAGQGLVSFAGTVLDAAYKELTLRPRPGTFYRAAIHVWPRRGFFLMALPDATADTFRATLVLPRHGANGFAELQAESVGDFVHQYFPDVEQDFAALRDEFARHPVSRITTASCSSAHWADSVALVGDAAHTIAPFLGQGINLGFEDCLVLHTMLGDHRDRAAALEYYSWDRTINGAAAATLSMDNYGELTTTAPPPQATALPPPRGDSGVPPAPILVNFYGLSYSDAYARLHARDATPAGAPQPCGTYVRQRTW